MQDDQTSIVCKKQAGVKCHTTVLRLSPFWFQVEPFWVVGRTLFGFHVELSVEMVPSGTKRVLARTKKGYSKGSPMGTAERTLFGSR